MGTPERGSSSTYRKWDCPGRDPGIILFLPAMLFVTYFAGLGPGILTALLSGITLWYVFLPPYYSFAFSPDNAVGLATFAFGGIAGVHPRPLAADRYRARSVEKEKSASLTASVTADLVGMTRLNELGSLLVREGKELKTCLNHALEAVMQSRGRTREICGCSTGIRSRSASLHSGASKLLF